MQGLPSNLDPPIPNPILSTVDHAILKHPPNMQDYFLKGSLTILYPIQSSEIYTENLSGKAGTGDHKTSLGEQFLFKALCITW